MVGSKTGSESESFPAGIAFPVCSFSDLGVKFGGYESIGSAKSDHSLVVGAGIAQLVEQLICNQQVRGSSPRAG